MGKANLSPQMKLANEVPLRLVLGGKGGDTKNWLAELPEGTEFHSRPKTPEFLGNTWSCNKYSIEKQYLKSTLLRDILDLAEEDTYDVVDSEAFSESNILVEVIVDGRSNRTY